MAHVKMKNKVFKLEKILTIMTTIKTNCLYTGRYLN